MKTKEYTLKKSIRAYQWGVDPTIEILNACKGYVYNENLTYLVDAYYNIKKRFMAFTCSTCYGDWEILHRGDWIVVEDIGGNDTWEVTDVLSDEAFKTKYEEV